MVSNAIVVGGGIGGLAAAALLARRGVAVTLVEQAAEISEVGAGLQISPNGLAVLRDLGLQSSLIRMGAVLAEAVSLCDYQGGRQVARLDLTRLGDQQYFFVHRADLVALLARAARQANVSFELGRKVVDIAPGPISSVQFEDSGTSRAELVVCADGLHSVGRKVLNGASEPQFTGQIAWRALVPATDVDPVATVTMGPGRHIVSYPLRGGSMTNLVAVQERAEWAAEGWNHSDDPANLRAAFTDFSGPCRSMLETVQTVNLWGLFRHPVAERWFGDGTVLLGDAAHPTLPFLAQGANLALEDAWVLANTVSAGQTLESYQNIRRPRAEKVIEAANGNAWKYHMHPGLKRSAAHLALLVGSRLAPGLMIRQFDWIYRHDVTQQ